MVEALSAEAREKVKAAKKAAPPPRGRHHPGMAGPAENGAMKAPKMRREDPKAIPP